MITICLIHRSVTTHPMSVSKNTNITEKSWTEFMAWTSMTMEQETMMRLSAAGPRWTH
jgi:hypothetical protein